MTYQALAFDLDGTLLTAQATILEENKAAIQRAREKGIKVFIVTGRHHTAVRPFYAELDLDTPVVCCNGTYLYDFKQDKLLEANPLSQQQAAFLIHKAKKAQIHTAVYTRDAMTYEVLNPHFEKLLKWVAQCPEVVRPQVHQVETFQTFLDNHTMIFKVLISDPDLAKMQKFVENLPLDEYSPEWSWVDRVDISRAGNSKGNRLAQLLAREGIPLESVIAFGDNFNDISMLSSVGMGIVMAEADQAVQAAARRTIGSHNEPSIAKALAELLV